MAAQAELSSIGLCASGCLCKVSRETTYDLGHSLAALVFWISFIALATLAKWTFCIRIAMIKKEIKILKLQVVNYCNQTPARTRNWINECSCFSFNLGRVWLKEIAVLQFILEMEGRVG